MDVLIIRLQPLEGTRLLSQTSEHATIPPISPGRNTVRPTPASSNQPSSGTLPDHCSSSSPPALAA